MRIESHKIKVVIYSEDKTEPTFEIEKGAIVALDIHQSIGEVVGTFAITLIPHYYGKSFYKDVKINSLVEIYIDNKLRFQGIMTDPAETGQVSTQGKINRSIVLRGKDMGYLLKDVHKTLNGFDKAYASAEAKAYKDLGTLFLDERKIKDHTKQVYKTIMAAIKEMNGGEEYIFADGQKISEKWGESGDSVFVIAENNKFYLGLPLSIHYLQPEKSIYDFIAQISDLMFSEAFGDTFHDDDTVSLGGTEKKLSKKGYRFIIRPKVFDSANATGSYYFTDNVYYDIKNMYFQYSVTKNAQNIFNYFSVGNAAFGYDANVGIAIGSTPKILAKSMSTFGYRPLLHNIQSMWGEKANENKSGVTDVLKKLVSMLAEWYTDGENYLNGQISFPYTHEARIGRNIRFNLPKDKKDYVAYTSALDIKFDAASNRLYNVITYNFGKQRD